MGSKKKDSTGKRARTRGTIDQALVNAVGHPVRIRILEALQGRSASPTEMAREFNINLGVVAYHVKTLLADGVLEETDQRPVRGTVEHFWTAVPRSFIGHQDWRKVPLVVRGGITKEAFRTFVDRFQSAVEAGSIDERDDTTLNWMPVTVDDRGWVEIAELLDDALRGLQRVAAESRDRLGPAKGISVVTGLAAFESPPVSSPVPKTKGK